MRTKHAALRILAGLAGATLVLAVAMLTAVQAGTKSDARAKVTATATKPDDKGKQIVTVTFAIDKGWHLYANPVGNREFEETRTEVKVQAGAGTEVKVAYPPGKTIKDKDTGDRYRIYEERVTVRAEVIRANGDNSPLEVTVKFNACNDKGCLPPAKLKFKGKDGELEKEGS